MIIILLKVPEKKKMKPPNIQTFLNVCLAHKRCKNQPNYPVSITNFNSKLANFYLIISWLKNPLISLMPNETSPISPFGLKSPGAICNQLCFPVLPSASISPISWWSPTQTIFISTLEPVCAASPSTFSVLGQGFRYTHLGTTNSKSFSELP